MATETQRVSSQTRKKLSAMEVFQLIEQTNKELRSNQFATYEVKVNKYEILEV